ncbi:Bile salt-activated lipase [Papilio machaon]|uniref:Carboxylic ester hydrolase n=1 Tax=Papilio machaon TaxID=76193 RepID=A0A0N1IGW1_PAPMA|nr:Bile salt-activated lipase [Papilio machaon]
MKVLVYLLVITGAWASPRLDPLVDSKKGLIRGLQATDGDYAMFLGIPYAMVNYTNPFGAALPYPDFEGTFEAYDDSAICVQNLQRTDQAIGSLDCLHLNIYVPNKASTSNKLPVIFWIHGGIFVHGNGGRTQFGAKYLVKKDVILVTINYRVGLYGFMCLDTPEVPGNQGLKDQVAALRWIKENIEAFGGDPNKVTISGASAGGVSVDYHLLTKTERLFDKVISQSGTSLCPWGVMESDRNVPIRIATHLGYVADDINEAVQYLATIDPKVVVTAAFDLSITCVPCVEKEFDGVENFITEHPMNYDIPKAKNTPILIGYTNMEKLFEFYNKPADKYNEREIFEDNLALAFHTIDDDQVKLVRQFYIGDEPVSENVKYELTDYDSDFTFIHPIHRRLSSYLDNNGTVYHYVFRYSGDRNFGKMKDNIIYPGAIHSDEYGYLFNMAVLTDIPTVEDQVTIDRMTTMWSNFAKYGDPTPEISELLPIKWMPITKGALNYLEIDKELTMKKRSYHARMAFWDLYYQTNKKSLRGYKDK